MSSKNDSRPRFLLLFFLFFLPSAVSAQTKDTFVEGLVLFVTAVDGLNAGDGTAVMDAIQGMEVGLAQWDRAIASAEAGMNAQIAGAPPAAAARMRAALGLMYLERARVADAVRQFDAAVKAEATRADLQLFRAWALDAAGKTADASAALARAFELEPATPVYAYLFWRRAPGGDAGLRALAALHDAEATIGSGPPLRFLGAGLLDDGGAPEPLLPWTRYATGYELLAQGHYAEAVASLRAAASTDPLTVQERRDEERTRAIAADGLLRDGKVDAARQLLEDAVRALPASAPAQWRLGRLYRAIDREADALRHLQAAAQAAPLAGAGALHRLIGQLRENQLDAEGALDSFRRAIALNPNDPAAHRELAEALQGLDRLDEARAEFVVSLLLDPADVPSWVGLGQLHTSEGRLDRALAVLQKAISLDGRHLEARYALSRLLIRLGRPEEGARELQRFEALQREAMEARRRGFQEAVK